MDASFEEEGKTTALWISVLLPEEKDVSTVSENSEFRIARRKTRQVKVGRLASHYLVLVM